MKKLGILTCSCGTALRARGAQIVCDECGRSTTRAAAEFSIISEAAERRHRIDKAGIQVDHRDRLVFLFSETSASQA